MRYRPIVRVLLMTLTAYAPATQGTRTIRLSLANRYVLNGREVDFWLAVTARDCAWLIPKDVICSECNQQSHGEHDDAVTFGLVKCECPCHSPGYVAGPNAMPWVQGAASA